MPHAARSLPSIAVAAFVAATPSACSASDGLIPERTFTAPLSELSGLAVRETAAGIELLAVGDEDDAVTIIATRDGVPDTSRTRRLAMPWPPTGGGSDFEAVTTDADGRLWLLAERGEIIVVALDGDAVREVSRRAIEVPPDHPLHAAWRSTPKARAEGLVLLPGPERARVFITKQSEPAALIELREEATRFVAARHHLLGDMDDASDLARAGDTLYVIGAASQKICALPIPDLATPATIPCARTVSLPGELGGKKARWEGLALLPGGRLVAGVDRKKTDRDNLALFPALTDEGPR